MHVHMKAVVRFGRTETNPSGVEVFVGLSSAVSEAGEVEFKTLHSTCKQPIRQAHFCDVCGSEAAETLKGFEVMPHEFVTFTADEVKALKPPRSPYIDLAKFVPRNQITPLMTTSHSYLVPRKLMEDDYASLYQALVANDRAGLGTQSLYGKEHPCVVVVQNGVLMLSNLCLSEQLREPDFAPVIPEQTKARMATEIVKAMSGELLPGDLVSESNSRILSLIQLRYAGVELPPVEAPAAREAVDMTAALKATLAALKEKKKPTARKPKAKS